MEYQIGSGKRGRRRKLTDEMNRGTITDVAGWMSLENGEISDKDVYP